VPLAIEIIGAPILEAAVDAQKAVISSDVLRVLTNLERITSTIQKMVPVLKRMYEKCNPAVFNHRIRSYSGGSKNSTSFPNGLFYEGVTEVRVVNVDGSSCS
jgi:indoleamine 2,3-dioxygenase